MCKKMYNDLCEICSVAENFAQCRTDYDSIMLDDITRNVVECKNFVARQPYKIKCTYECDGQIAVVEKETYKFPDHLPWKDKPKRKKSEKFKKPTVEEIRAYCLERNSCVNPQEFYDKNESVGWTVGSTAKPMKDWKAAVRTWESNERKSRSKEQKNRLQSQPTYNLDEYKQFAAENTEI